MRRFHFIALACLVGGIIRADPLRPLQTNDVVALIGGAQLASVAESGYLEALLAVRNPGGPPRFRDFSWEGDTVFSRPRPVNFPALTNLLARAGATVALLQFGQMESLAGREGLPGFESAYAGLLDSLRPVVSRIVLLTPTPFTAAGPLNPDLVKDRNEVLAAYVAAVRWLGEQHMLPVVDLFGGNSPATAEWSHRFPLTSDGVQLTDLGQQRMAQRVALAWGETGVPDWRSLEPVRQAVAAKNRLWFRYWRPTNWAFLAGDRTEQPSSRDHRDRNIRWFPREMEEYVPLISAADQRVAELAAAASKEAAR